MSIAVRTLDRSSSFHRVASAIAVVLAVSVISVAWSPETAWAKNPIPGVEAVGAGQPVGIAPADHGWRALLAPWERFLDGYRIATLLSSVVLAVLLAASLAYHPWSYGKARTLVELESPKVFLMYAVVGAVCGRLALMGSVIGFVIFGIGGLMRFRTDVGAPKDTGRVILVTCVGLCCGLDLPDVAVVSTALAYLLIIVLERRTVYKLMIKGLQPEHLVSSADAHRDLLEEMGCSIISEKKSFVKLQVAFVFRASSEYDQDDIEDAIKEHVAEEHQGAVDWQTS